MDKGILNTNNQSFINNNINSNVHALLLKSHAEKRIDIKSLIEQIESKKKCLLKLPSWYNCENIYYPNKLNIEQTSSEDTADFKAKLVDGNTIIDLTGGFGVDSYYFAKHFKQVTYCEINKALSEIVEHNYIQLGANNIKVISDDGLSYLESSTQVYDCIYIDPSRRHDVKGKVFYLNDCLPNVPKHLDLLLKHGNTILIKTSPMLDIAVGISELKHIKSIHIVAVNNEVKELLFLIEKNSTKPIKVYASHIKGNAVSHFSFLIDEEYDANISLATRSLKYLYEPNSAILKSGGFKSVGQRYGLKKLHQHSHLYMSDNLVDFPGRRFSILKVIPYQKKEILKQLKNKTCHITTRNFPESVAQLKAKFKTKDGGDLYVFFTTNCNNKKIVIMTSKI